MGSGVRIILRRWYIRWFKGRNVFGWMMALYLVGFIGFAMTGDRGLVGSFRLWVECQKLDGEIVRLEQDVRQLRQTVDLFRHDLRTIEKFAREDLHLVGKNEVHYIFK